MSRWHGVRGVSLLAGMSVIALALTACGASGNAAAKSSSKPVLIGLATPLTGGNPSEGTSERVVAEDAVAYINSHGGIHGRKLKLIIQDTGGSAPTGAVSAFEALASDHVSAVLGEWTSTAFAAACTIAMSEHVVLLGHASGTEGLTTGKPYCFRNEYQVDQSSGAMLSTVKKEGWNPIAIATDTTSFGVAENDSWDSQAPSYGVTVATDVTWESPATTLSAQVLQIKESKAKAVFVGSGSGPDVTLLAKTMQSLGVKLPIFGPGGVSGPGVAASAGSAYSALPAVYDITSYDSSVSAEAGLMARVAKQTGLGQGGGNITRLYELFQATAAGLRKSHGAGGSSLIKGLQSLGKIPSPLAGGQGTYMHWTAGNHSGLYGPHLLTVYKWSASAQAFKVDAALSAAADKSPGINS